MNRGEIIEVLNACLWSMHGESLEEIKEKSGLNPSLAEIGYKLCKYLENKSLFINSK